MNTGDKRQLGGHTIRVLYNEHDIADLAGATTYGLPGFIQDAALYALTEYAEHEAEVADRYRRRRDIALDVLSGSNALGFVPPDGTFGADLGRRCGRGRGPARPRLR